MYPSRLASAYCSLALWTACSSSSSSAAAALSFRSSSSAFRRPVHRALTTNNNSIQRFHLAGSTGGASTGKRYEIGSITSLSMSTDAPASVDIAANLAQTQDRVDKACAARSEDNKAPVRLVAVSKTKPIEMLQAAYDAGCRIFGENYAQELIGKIPQLPDDVRWHYIGALQSNKANMLVKAVGSSVDRLTVETVGSIKLANKLNNAVPDEASSRLKVFVQVNTSGEESKSGVAPGDECIAICEHIVKECPKLELLGLMTIGAVGDLGCFQVLKDCRSHVAEALGVEASTLELSMGMSGDFEEAIEAGATNVRVGSTIFGARDYSNEK